MTACLKKRNCPCCRSPQHELLYGKDDVAIETPSASWQVKLCASICKACGMVYLNPAPSQNFYNAFYASQYRVSGEDVGFERKRKQQSQFEFCKTHIPDFSAGKSVFDVGAFDGSFLNHFKAAGWRVSGCDLSETGVQQAWKRHRIAIAPKDFLQVPCPPEGFDVITSFQTLEHILNPVALLKQIRKHLSENGLLILEIPNLDAPSENNLANYFDIEHVSYFEIGSISNCLGLSGFAVQHWEIFELNQSLRIIARKSSENRNFQVLNHYEANRRRVLNYASRRREIVSGIRKKLLPHRDRKIIVYGAGQHTEQLFREVDLTGKMNLVGMVDSDPLKHGKHLWGFDVQPPESIAHSACDAVLISSFSFMDAIEARIREICGNSIEIIRLYE